VQFHPSYDYTDFVEGLRPVNNNNQIVFERKDGIFKAFCEKALKAWNDELNAEKTPFVFIIDEINRGEISKIFGELFFSIDPGYRGTKGAVKTQYANLQEDENVFDKALKKVLPKVDNGHFFIPENVYIIGTMNDIDRSVESMDFAFRRRFTFIEIKAKDTQLEILNSMQEAKAKDKIKELVEKMDSLNKAIYDPKNSTGNQYDLSEAYHIGAAYFKHYEDYAEQDKPFDKLWDNHLKGVLFEYLRGKPDANKILDNWKKAYNIFPAKK
jgi:5-methylcytosine-specific restriction protein B